MAAQKRWLCTGCAREFAHIAGWTDGDPCLICGAALEQMTYVPDVPGGDIPRGPASVVLLPALTQKALDEIQIPDPIRGVHTTDNYLLNVTQGGH